MNIAYTMLMRKKAPRLEFPLPLADEDLRLAHRLVGTKNRLDLAILRTLVGRPRRYSELQPLLGGKNDNNLNMALQRLRRDGLIRQRRVLTQTPTTLEYELSTQGIRVYELSFQILPIADAVALYRRAEGVSAA